MALFEFVPLGPVKTTVCALWLFSKTTDAPKSQLIAITRSSQSIKIGIDKNR